MAQTLDLTGLTPEQIEQINQMIATFKAINQQQVASSGTPSELDLNSLFFASDILQPFNRTLLYGDRR